MRRASIILLWLVGGCAGTQQVSSVRFANQPIIWHVNDKKHVAKPPAENPFYRLSYHYDGLIHRRITYALTFPGEQRALNTNALGEVPNSTWFTNRIGQKDVSPAQVAAGPNQVGSPEGHYPWTILSSKIGGASLGFIVKDARGERFLLKFDKKEFPEVETGADVITQRILYAAGYNTPEDYIVGFREKDLVVDKEAYTKDLKGNKNPLDRARLLTLLNTVGRNKDGSIRGLASIFLSGKPLGGHTRERTRPGDRNDTIDHRFRRELRGTRAIFGWLEHTDVKADNTIDMYDTDPKDKNRRYVVHYFLDFGKSLGAEGRLKPAKYPGHEFAIDLVAIAKSLFSLGIWQHTWEGRPDTPYRGLGLWDAHNFDPKTWRSVMQSYFPMYEIDRFDGFWGAKIVARFTDAHMRAAIAQAKFTDPRTEKELLRILKLRQEKSIRYWFAQLSPLDSFRIRKQKLCAKDLAIAYKLAKPKDTSYRLAVYDDSGRRLSATNPGSLCHSLRELPYQIVKWTVVRSGKSLPAVEVHIGQRAGGFHVIGVWRH